MFFFKKKAVHSKCTMIENRNEDDDRAPAKTTCYKPGERKTPEDCQTLNAENKSLNKWKESLSRSMYSFLNSRFP